jgi:hypothetical protein
MTHAWYPSAPPRHARRCGGSNTFTTVRTRTPKVRHVQALSAVSSAPSRRTPPDRRPDRHRRVRHRGELFRRRGQPGVPRSGVHSGGRRDRHGRVDADLVRVPNAGRGRHREALPHRRPRVRVPGRGDGHRSRRSVHLRGPDRRLRIRRLRRDHRRRHPVHAGPPGRAGHGGHRERKDSDRHDRDLRVLPRGLGRPAESGARSDRRHHC